MHDDGASGEPRGKIGERLSIVNRHQPIVGTKESADAARRGKASAQRDSLKVVWLRDYRRGRSGAIGQSAKNIHGHNSVSRIGDTFPDLQHIQRARVVYELAVSLGVNLRLVLALADGTLT